MKKSMPGCISLKKKYKSGENNKRTFFNNLTKTAFIYSDNHL